MDTQNLKLKIYQILQTENRTASKNKILSTKGYKSLLYLNNSVKKYFDEIATRYIEEYEKARRNGLRKQDIIAVRIREEIKEEKRQEEIRNKVATDIVMNIDDNNLIPLVNQDNIRVFDYKNKTGKQQFYLITTQKIYNLFTNRAEIVNHLEPLFYFFNNTTEENKNNKNECMEILRLELTKILTEDHKKFLVVEYFTSNGFISGLVNNAQLQFKNNNKNIVRQKVDKLMQVKQNYHGLPSEKIEQEVGVYAVRIVIYL